MKYSSSILLFIIVATSCTNFREEEVPVSFGTNVSELSYDTGSSLRPVIISSGTKWSVATMPEWMRLESISSSNGTPYEWTANFLAEANDGYDREGQIVIKANTESAEIAVSQAGKKGRYVAVESITLASTALTLTEEESASLLYTILPANASVKEISWESSSTSVATVSETGEVNAISPGTAQITVTTADGGKTASCAVTVKAKVIPVSSVSLNKTSLTMTVGDTETLVSAVLPENATDPSVTWTSGNTSIATVSSTGEISAKAVGSTTITVKTNDGGKTAFCTLSVTPVNVSSVTLNRETLSLILGETVTLTATVLPENAANKNVSWTSSNAGVASVDASGKVSAQSVGTAKITVTTEDGGKTASCSVTVSSIAVTGISLNKTTMSLLIGGTEKLTATVSPSNATNKNVSWTSSNSNIVTVDSNGNVSAIKDGTAVITATTEDGGKKATCSVTVNPIAVTGVSLSQTSLTMTVGDTQALSATVTPSNATDKSVTWSSSNTSVATVSSSGLVTAKAAGSATITVTTNDGGKKATCSVTVQAKTVAVTGVSLDKTSLSMTEGETYTLTATVSPTNATNKSVTWTSSSNSVATVSSTGVITAKAAGSATITVTTTDGAKTATCTVTVKAATVPVTGVSLNKTSLSMVVGDTETLTATITPSNATDKSVTWTSNNTSVATVSSTGVITAKVAGNATITVTTNDGAKKATCSVKVNAATVAVTGVSLNTTSLTMTTGDTQTLVASVLPSNATDKSVTWSSSNTTVATVSSSGFVTAKAAGIASITVTTTEGAKTATCYVYVADYSYEYVDLGLPSGLKWATCNLGASSPQGNGYKYAWGEIEMKTYNDYHWQDYKWWNGSSSTLTKYNSIDGKKVLEAADDVASVILGGKWRLPTDDEWTELRTQCTWVWTHLNGALGRLITGKNGNSLFLPSAGSWGNHPRYYAGTYGNYWSSSLNTNNPNEAWYVTFDSEGVYRDSYTRCVGFSVRPVYAEISATGVNLDKSLLNMTVGDTETLTATVLPSNATDKSVTWKSSNTTVATVSSSGVVTAKAAGTATITVTTTDGSKTATCTVTVKAAIVSVTGVSLNKSSLSMTVGDEETLTATVTPSNATNKNVSWTSSNSSVATVNSNGSVSAVKVGTAVITVTTEDGGKTASCMITVNPISVTGVSLNHTDLTMFVGDTQTLSATVIPSNATDKSVSWTSSNTAVASVSSSGVVSANAIGNATITVTTTDGGNTSSCSIKVVEYNRDYVDLGLPSGLKWATCNIGATSPEQGGNKYAWGEVETKSIYWWSTYKWCNYNSSNNSVSLTKYYNSSSSKLQYADDVAYIKLGWEWRMPTNADWAELQLYCTWTWTTQNGVYGELVTGPNGNSIFLPSAGLNRYGDYGYVGGYYWSSSLSINSIENAWSLSFYSSNISRGVAVRYSGFSIRPVYSE